ncbi:MAG: hypothetical protein HY023_00050 [Chloroflexi bacterium]|nr:hypothetical protein [Chloroflexota bacterium]MBI3760716.1 hypothetical protein [Chloroflexota bacterium]
MEATRPSIWDVYREGSKFFMKEGDVYETLRHLAAHLKDEGLDYAVIGAMALVAHGYRRFTEGIDVLMTPETLRLFKEHFVGRGYVPAFSTASKSFRDTSTGVKIEVMTTGEYPGDGKPKPVVFPDPLTARVEKDDLWVLALEKLIELKVASGLSAPHRLKDLADVQEMIVALKLPLDLGERLDESVRAEYRRLWEAAQQASEGPHERPPI